MVFPPSLKKAKQDNVKMQVRILRGEQKKINMTTNTIHEQQTWELYFEYCQKYSSNSTELQLLLTSPAVNKYFLEQLDRINTLLNTFQSGLKPRLKELMLKDVLQFYSRPLINKALKTTVKTSLSITNLN